MKTITVDGKKFIEAYSGPVKIVVLEHGFVYIGRVEMFGEDVAIHSARSLIRWGTQNHLGQLINGPLENTKLGDPCEVLSRLSQVIHLIEVNQDAWNKYID